jgi:hypothetical protein
MSDDLDLAGIDQRHEPDPEFRAALQRRVAAIVAGREPSDRITDPRGTTTLELEPAQERSASPRRGRSARIVVVAASAAAVVAAIAMVTSRDDSTAPADAPIRRVTVGRPPTSTASQPSTVDELDRYGQELRVGDLDPGTYAYLEVDGQAINVRFTVPAGWTWNGRYLSKGGVDQPDGAAIFFFGGPVQVYADPCHWQGQRSEPVTGRAVIDLLAAQPMRSATAPTDSPADEIYRANSIPGRSVELTVPHDMDFRDCDGGQYRSWGPERNARIHQGPWQRDLVWVLDVQDVTEVDDQGRVVDVIEGGLIIDAAWFWATPADVMMEIDAILESIALGQWG